MMQKIFGSDDDHPSLRLIVHGSASDILGAEQQEENGRHPNITGRRRRFGAARLPVLRNG